ncbi:zinc finger protein 407-like [Xyrauchen texanus]|uniref:zinc finger protein 407-like n=1 Tax=Xyrauchen texanus TaxID=154827 RepID=UPI0022418CC3|nr:zinc finger protein 407-like [Xyrauchen texanus]XP_051999861.1 zinc finger protein 407-like [Xyrauchen texanus]XP_051999862.1 zinc finger protein 407-like [Xyrauchen texanus]
MDSEMDNPKQKFRSGKEISEDKGLPKNKASDTDAEDVSHKRAKGFDESGIGSVAEESEHVVTSTAEECSDECDSSYITDALLCSLCNFVAKTQTALKIHSKRKHSMRPGLHIKNEKVFPGINSMQKTSELQESNNQTQLSESQLKNTSEELNNDKEPNEYTVQTESKHTHRSFGDQSVISKKVVNTSAERSSPTQMLLEMVEPTTFRPDKDIEDSNETLRDGNNAQAGCSFDSESKVESQENGGLYGHDENHKSQRHSNYKTAHACSYCEHEFRDRPSLDTHVKRRHTKEINYFCDFCSYSCVAKCDYEKHCLSNKHKRKMSEQQEMMTPEELVSPPPATRMPTRSAGSRAQHQCSTCSFTANSSVMLAQHVKMNHPAEHRFHCRACHYYTTTTEAMEIHLSGEAHQQVAKEKNISPLFKDCVEKILVILLGDQREDGKMDDSDTQEVQEAEDVSTVAELTETVGNKRKRGRPKTSNVTVCSHCGLVASNATNLSVHIRRRHSRLYSFVCKLCNYYCVTKGDMDRHCETRKHINKMQAAGSEGTGVVLLDSEQPGEAKEDEAELGDRVAEIETSIDDVDQIPLAVRCKKSKNDLSNSCTQCEFVAHSTPSLALHVRRKHTKDFEFVCLACSYYTVTRREMFRHAATEKHKQKCQSYLERQNRSVKKDQSESIYDDQETLEGSEQGCDNSDPTSETATTEVAECSVNGCEENCTNEEGPEQTSSESQEPSANLTESGVSDVVQSVVIEKDSVLEVMEEENMFDEDEMADLKGDNLSVEKRFLRVIAFDACIFPLKALAEHKPPPANDQTTGVSPQQDIKKPKSGSETKTTVPNPRIRCDDCGFLADGSSGLNVHISMKHPSKEKHFHCLLCGKSFYTESNMQQHLSSAAHVHNEQGSIEGLPEGGASFKCVRCNEPCQTEQELFIHIKEKHEELLREVNKYVLEDTEQINRERQENQGSVCKYCGKVCKSSNSMAFLAHVRTHTGSKPFMCKICSFATAQLGDARNHVKRHLGMREYKCHICGWAFVMKKHLNTHLLGKHGLGQPKERKFECELCERNFSEKWALNNHMKLHTGEKPYKCSWPSCHYSFLTLSAMKDHHRTHTGEKSFLCDLCGFAGGTRHALTKHRRQHTGERPFKCQMCNFASTTQSHLTRHKRVHTGEKPYRCPWCDYRSNCAENIRKHILHTGKHEGVKMYNCPKCNYATNAPMDFRNHLKETHTDIENPDLAYLHAGIMSKSFECRLKGQGATFVQSEAAFAPNESKLSSEAVQQVIIIQGYDGGEVTIDHALEESAAATLQTLAMSSHLAEVLHITEDGQLIASGRQVSSVEAQLAGGQIQIPGTSTRYVLVESSGETTLVEQRTVEEARQEGVVPGNTVSDSSSALNALLCAVTELGQQSGTTEGEITTKVSEHLLDEECGDGSSQTDSKNEGQVYEEGAESMGMVTQIVGSPHEHTSEEMQEVLQFAASQLMMKEGLTQVIVNDEGTHYIVTQLDGSTLQVESAVEEPTAEGTIVYSQISPE